ncbi:MAG: hypothetical protein ACXVAX_06390 [Pseudobdellovibrio sp.]
MSQAPLVSFKQLKKWSLRTGFVAALLGAGFIIENSLQKYLSQNSVSNDASTSEHRILFVGGSVLHGIAEAVNNYFAGHNYSDKVSITAYTHAALNSGESLEIVKKQMDQNKFDAVVLMIGLNETSPLDSSKSTSEPPPFEEQKFDHYEDVEKLLKEQKFDTVLSDLQKAIHAALHENLRHPYFFLRVLTRDAFTSGNFDLLLRIKNLIEPEVLNFIHDPQRDMKFMPNYIMLTRDGIMLDLMLDSATRDEYFKNIRRLDGDEKSQRVADLINNFDKKINAEIRSSRESDCLQTNIPAKYVSPFQKYEICLAVFTNGGHLPTDAQNFFLIQNGVSIYYLIFLTKEMSQSEVDKMNTFIPAYFSKYVNNARRAYLKENSEEDKKVFFENVEKIQEIVKAKNSQLILMQPPNATLETVKHVAQNLNLPIIEDENLLKAGIEKNGYFYYFNDHAGPTGHLTPEGLSIFGPFVGTQLLKYLGISEPNFKSENK